MKKSIFFILLLLSFLGNSQDLKNVSVSIEKLPINSSLSEISSDFVDGNLLYFKNKKAIKRYSQFYDLFLLDSNSLKDNNDNKRVSLTDQLTIVTTYHEGPCFVDHVNNKIYITISSLDKREMKREKRLNNLTSNRLRLVEGDYNNGVISNLKEFPFNNPVYNIAHATYSHSTKRLYFASTMPGGIGESDIFYCTKKLDGSWSEPVNIGKRVNTEGDEYFPYVKNGILFFSSNSQRKQVGTDLDVYYIKESNLLTEFPVPLDGMNSDRDDFAICFTKSDSVMQGYFTSNRGNKFSEDDDIYSFRFTNVDYSPNFDLFVQFTKEGKYLSNGTTTLVDDEGNEILIDSIAEDKVFSFNQIKKGVNYKILFNNEEYSRIFDVPMNVIEPSVYHVFDIENDAEFKDTLIVKNVTKLVGELDSVERKEAKVDSIDVNPVVINSVDTALVIKDTGILTTVTEKNVPVVKDPQDDETVKFNEKESFDNIYFAFDSYKIYKYSQDKLDKLISYVKKNNINYIVIEAHTDSRGSSAYNQKLSIKRALACREYLMNHGIPESKIKYTGFGEKKLVNNCGNGVSCPDKKHLKNRRIEFTLLK